MIHEERISNLNENSLNSGEYVLYWMQASPRSHCNHALEFAVRKSNELKKPLIVFFGVTPNFPDANNRHMRFLLEGLKNTAYDLEKKNIQIVIKYQEPDQGIIELYDDAVLTVTDKGYLSIQKEWYDNVAENIQCPLIQVETNVIVPVETASPKEDYSAGTIRRKIQRELKFFLQPLKEHIPKISSLDYDFDSLPLEDASKIMKQMNIKNQIKNSIFTGGSSEAINLFNLFLEEKLDKFADFRNDPSKNYASNMSPYLHFGQISPLYLALESMKTNSPGLKSFLEELIIRRELSMNFVHYNEHYDRFDCLPDWAATTLLEHRNDKREYSYNVDELEYAQTHDPYWNAAQKEVIITGKMHGYMRMYWGKKILEWVDDPRKAYDIALYINNKYELDGRDPNGYAGVAWCFGKHDRAWKERAIFGKVRYMNANGLRRKFKINKYVERIENLEYE
ncbi:deoxyribodipyrimidine photo-lyase [Methanobacterium alcaliphilum]|uniref:deoxyribodipyrimidine photo-lyase n=1 Tax=Methanobacterium alcaliphilum TaxID=392018 RepID=UPI00200A8AAE|nr:deoxyribodipyrimidine photo-lyase [Methanobacterium alcaliphilum]MCK9150960.1 deoxyribodipyrimidine photo-lyase [Methanobacterium alcaliphilum]